MLCCSLLPMKFYFIFYTSVSSIFLPVGSAGFEILVSMVPVDTSLSTGILC